MTKITAHEVDHLDLLHRLGDATGVDTITALAGELGRDKSNLTKTIKKLRDNGLVGDGISLTDAGRMVTRVLATDGEITVSGDEVLRRWDELEPDDDNERKHVDLEGLTALKHSLLTHGQLQNLIVRPGSHGVDIIVVGWSRWRAIGDAIADGLWAADRPLRCRLVSGSDAKQLMLTRLAENLHRTDLHRLDEGGGYVRLRDEFNLDVHAIATAVDRSAKHVADHIRLVEKLPDHLKARMFLPEGHADHLAYVDARREIQAQNAKPKPAVDVDPKEALVLMEVLFRGKDRPSHDPYAHGRDGWTRITEAPDDSVAAKALLQKGLIETRDHAYDDGRFAFYVRVAPDKVIDVAGWVADQGAMALWSARVAVISAGAVGSLEQSGRYATPWLNDPLPEPEPAPDTPSAPAPAPAALPVAERQAQPEPGSDFEEDEVPPYLAKLAGVPETPPPSRPPEGGTAHDAVTAGPSAPSVDAPDLTLTAAELTILTEVWGKISDQPLAGRADPKTGEPAFWGCAVGEYHRDAKAIHLVTPLRLLAFVPSAKDVQMCVLTARAKAWLAANPQPALPKPPYATAWLNPPVPAAKAPAAAEPDAGVAPTHTYFAKPVITPPTEFTCGHCERDFEISGEIEADELVESLRFDDDVVQGDYFRPPVAGAECPHCKAQLTLLCAEIYLVKDIG